MGRRESENWQFGGPIGRGEARHLSAFEREVYDHAKQSAISRGRFLKLAGAGVGATLLGPVASAGARSRLLSQPARRADKASSTLIWGRSGPPTTLDPQRTGSIFDAETIQQINDSLVYLGGNGMIYAGLATAWAFSKDGKSLTFKLRKGVVFHDGTPFNAAAVKYSMDRWVAPATASPLVPTMTGTLTHTVVNSAYQVTMHFSTPFQPILGNLGEAYAAIVSPAAVKKYGAQYGRHPVGTGPYKFISWTSDDTITLKANPLHTWATPYYVQPNGKPLNRGPAIQTAILKSIPNDNTRFAALEAGQIDVNETIPTNLITQAKKNKNLQVQVVPERGVYGFGINAGRAPTNDVRVRAAISHAINKEKLVKLALQGWGTPGTSVAGSLYSDYWAGAKAYNNYDPAKAKSLLKQAGFANGVSITCLTTASFPTWLTDSFLLCAQDLSKVGITLQLQQVPDAAYSSKTALTVPLAQRPHLALFGYAYGNLAAVLEILFDGHNGEFLWHPNDPQLDTLLRKGVATLNTKEHYSISIATQKLMAERYYMAPWYEIVEAVAARKNVHNMHFDWYWIMHLQEMTKS